MQFKKMAQDKSDLISRRVLLKRIGALSLLGAIQPLIPACARHGLLPMTSISTQPATLSGELIELVISERTFALDGQMGTAMTMNGTIPGPLIRLKEGQEVTLRVTNRLAEITSIHWHGILLPPIMDGVPGVSFGGIKPGATFTYRFPIRQSGTYWYHSHSGGQELQGMYAPMILDPAEPEPFSYDREYVVMLSDWSFESPDTLLSHLKKQGGYYNFQKRAAREFMTDVRRMGFWTAIEDYLMWHRMRMDPTDFADVTGNTLTYLMNGLSSSANWTALFHPNQRIRLRFINAASMTFYDVRIPGLTMTVVQADGQNVQPVAIEEFRFGPAETYDVIIEPTEDRAYTIFAETMDRSGFARGTIAPRPGMEGEIPERRPRPLRTMEDMGMSMEGMEMKGMDMPHKKHSDGSGMAMPNKNSSSDMPSMKHGQHDTGTHDSPGRSHDGQTASTIPGSQPLRHGPDDHGTGNQMVAEYSQYRFGEPGRGLEDSPRRVLRYSDLKSITPYPDQRGPEREIELHLTGHMERFMWSFDGKKYSEEKQPIVLRHGERVRFTFVNDTMMEHPLHLHGMWMHLENGEGEYLPRKHTVIVKPAERVSVAITADAPGRWAFHCHLLLHMEAGMFRVVEVSDYEP